MGPRDPKPRNPLAAIAEAPGRITTGRTTHRTIHQTTPNAVTIEAGFTGFRNLRVRKEANWKAGVADQSWARSTSQYTKRTSNDAASNASTCFRAVRNAGIAPASGSRK